MIKREASEKSTPGNGILNRPEFIPKRTSKGMDPLTWWLKGGFPLLWFAIAAFLLYGQSISFGYSYLDDHTLILNQMERIGHMSHIPEAFREDVFHTPGGKGFYYRPVLTISFVLDAVAGKGSLTVFHFPTLSFTCWRRSCCSCA